MGSRWGVDGEGAREGAYYGVPFARAMEAGGRMQGREVSRGGRLSGSRGVRWRPADMRGLIIVPALALV